MPFERVDPTLAGRLVVSVARQTKAGGSHLALTFPEPIYVVNLDFGLEEILPKFKDKAIQVASHNIGEKSTLGEYKKQYAVIKQDWTQAVDLADQFEGTAVLDTSTQLWQLIYTIKLYEATNGDKDKEDASKGTKYTDDTEVGLIRALPLFYAAANVEGEYMFRLPLTRKNTNAVLIDRMTPIYSGQQKTDKWERQGYGRMEAIVPYAVELQYNPKPVKGADPRSALITAARSDPSLQGVTIPGPIDYDVLKDWLKA